jgi:ABC-2 type transport system ATP-binding protein
VQQPTASVSPSRSPAVAAGSPAAGASLVALGPLVVDAQDLSRHFGPVVAVDHLSLTIGAREVFGLIGPNGAGKSTLMKMFVTLLPPSSGRVLVAGYDVARAPQEVRRHIGYVPQVLSADGELTGYENMLLSARLYLIPHAEQAARVAVALSLMGLVEAKDRLVRTYSGGMARRLEIAQSTLHRPAVLFLDEPTVGLDPTGRQTVWKHLAALRQEIGAAVVFSTHYMDEAEAVCDRIAVIAEGQVKALGSPAELKARLGADATLDDVFTALTGFHVAADGRLQ